MGGSGGSSNHNTQNLITNITGGSNDLNNFFGNFVYKGGSISTTNTQSFAQTISPSSASSSRADGGAADMGFDIAASVGVGLGDGSGTAGAVDKRGNSLLSGSGSGSGKGLSTPLILAGGGIAIGLALMLARSK